MSKNYKKSISRPIRASRYCTWTKTDVQGTKGSENYHWVVISNINCSKDEINYYDSLFYGKIRDHVKMQICNIFKCNGKELTVNVKACKQQTNGDDCGVFAVANLFHILTGADIDRTNIQDDKMRYHLLQCIKSGHFKEFDKSNNSDIVFCKIK